MWWWAAAGMGLAAFLYGRRMALRRWAMERFKGMALALLGVVMAIAAARSKLADLLTDALAPAFAALRDPNSAAIDPATITAVLNGAAAVLRDRPFTPQATGAYDAAAIGRMSANLAGLAVDVVGHYFPGEQHATLRTHVATLLGDVAERVMA